MVMRVTSVRRVRRTATFLVAAVALLPLASPAAAFDPGAIVFPVVGPTSFVDSFSAPRSGGRTHGATDIMAAKMQPVVAADDGVVSWIGTSCCDLAIDHGSGWSTRYIHLNNDMPGTDDGRGWGIADGIAVGTRVWRGQTIGWVGDSGNAEDAGSHLHFEILSNGERVNPYPYLLTAPRLSAPAAAISGFFVDDDGSVHEGDIDALHARGITAGCGVDPARYCPEEKITRGQIAAFIRRALGLAPASVDFFADDAGNLFEADVNAVTAAGIGFGCSVDSYCPDRPLLREEMAELVVRAFGLPLTDGSRFADTAASTYADSIEALAAAGVTKGCDPADAALFCPERPVTRAEMASFFMRSFG